MYFSTSVFLSLALRSFECKMKEVFVSDKQLVDVKSLSIEKSILIKKMNVLF